VSDAFSSAGGAWVPNDITDAIAVSAYLLYHERPLPYRLKPSTSTRAAFALSSAGFGFAAFAGAAKVGSPKLHRLLHPIDRIHKIYFYCQ